MSDKVYTYDEYILSYDMGEENDRSCMIISKILNGNLYVMAELYDGSADIISIMLDNLQQQLQQKENIIKEVREYIENTTYADITGLETHSIKEFWFVKELLEILDKESK